MAEPPFRCACSPRADAVFACSEQATQEDGLCDICRRGFDRHGHITDATLDAAWGWQACEPRRPMRPVLEVPS